MGAAIVCLSVIALAVCFGAAAAGKLWTSGLDPAVLRSLGVPAGLAGPLRRGLPAVEAVTATMLAWVPTARLGATLAGLLLVVFSVLVLDNLRQGRRPPCNCFGSGSVRPLGPWVIMRNLALLAAVAAVLLGPPPALSLVGQLLMAAIVVIGVQGWLLSQAVLRRGSLERPATEPLLASPVGGPGIRATPFRLPTTDGSDASLAQALGAGQEVLLVFIDPDCGPCHRLLPAVAGWEQELADVLTVLVVSRGSSAANRALARQTGLARILVQRDFEVAQAFGVVGTPSGVLINRDGTLARPPAAGIDAITTMIMAQSGLGSGSGLVRNKEVVIAAPPDGHRRIPGLPEVVPQPHEAQPVMLGVDPSTGARVPAADPAGRLTVVLTSSAPGCEDCQTVLNTAVERLDQDRQRLVVLATESPTAGPAGPPSGLPLTVAVDRSRSVALALHLTGAPAIAILDSDGRPLTSPAIGMAPALATLDGLRTFIA